jgi:hypothetical protein
MAVDPDSLAMLASRYTRAMTSIRGRRVQRLIRREFAGADRVVLAPMANGAAAVVGVSASGAALCATDGTGRDASVWKWSHDSTRVQETRFDLLKDSLPERGAGAASPERLRALFPLRISDDPAFDPVRQLLSRTP